MIERIFVAPHDMDADQIAAQNSRREALSMFRPNFADGGEKTTVRADAEVFVRDFLRHRSRELSKLLPVLDVHIQIFGRVRIEWRSENAAIPQRARAEFHAPLHPGDNFVFAESPDRLRDQILCSKQIAEAELAVFEHALNIRSREFRAKA